MKITFDLILRPVATAFIVGSLFVAHSASANEVPRTRRVSISGNADASAAKIELAAIPTTSKAGAKPRGHLTSYSYLAMVGDFFFSMIIVDTRGERHQLLLFFFRTGARTWTVKLYVNSEEVDQKPAQLGLPRQAGTGTLVFGMGGRRSNLPPPGIADLVARIPWNNGARTSRVRFDFRSFRSVSQPSEIVSLSTR